MAHSTQVAGDPLDADVSSPLPPRLRGRRLLLARSIWLLLAAGLFADVIVGIPTYFHLLQTICASSLAECSFNALTTPGTVRALEHLGISLPVYATISVIAAVAIPVTYWSVGLLVFWRKSDEWLGLLISFLLILFGSLQFTNDLGGSWPPPDAPAIVTVFIVLMSIAQYPCLAVFLLTFPTGRFAPGWSFVIVLLWIAQFILFAAPAPYNVANWPAMLFAAELLIVWGGTLAVQVYRYRRVYTPLQRQQTKWVVFGIAIGLLIVVAYSLIGGVVPGLSQPDSPYQLLNGFVTILLFISIPVPIGIAILRYRLWDIDTLINQALVYGSLTALLALIYVGMILGLESVTGLLTHQSSNSVALVVSTLAIAALFLPIRSHLQALIDRRFYRHKYDAQKTLAAFGETLRSEVELEGLREQLLAVVQETMHPAQSSLWLRLPERERKESV